MELLYLDDNGQVLVATEAESYPEVQALRSGSIPFPKVIKYVYHTYSPGHPLSGYSWIERSTKVCRTYFSDDETPEYFEKDKIVKAFIKRYVEDTLTSSERFYEKLKKDMDDLKEHISNIPFSHKKSVAKDTIVKVLVSGKKVEGKLYESVEIEIDNSQEKLDAIKRAAELITMEEKIRKSLQQQKADNKKQDRNIRRIFDVR